MTHEERVEAIAQAMEGMSRSQWWDVVEAIEALYERASTEICLDNKEEIARRLICRTKRKNVPF